MQKTKEVICSPLKAMRGHNCPFSCFTVYDMCSAQLCTLLQTLYVCVICQVHIVKNL